MDELPALADEAAELPSPSASARWALMLPLLRRGRVTAPAPKLRYESGEPLDLERRHTDDFRRQTAERVLLLNLQLEVLLVRHARRRP